MIRLSIAVACLVFTAGLADAQPKAVRDACKADIASMCADITPGEGRLLECLRAHGDQVSEGCKAAMAARRSEKASGDSNAIPPPPSVPPPPPPP